MTKSQKADAIIISAVPTSMGAAAIPLPIADSVAITSVQISMVAGIAKVYERSFSGHILSDLVKVFFAAKVGEGLWGLAKGFGPIGWWVIVIQMGIASSVTTALGVAFKSMCEKGLAFNKKNLKNEKENTQSEADLLDKQFKAKKENYKKLKKQVGFSCSTSKFTNEVTFSFNIKGQKGTNLRIMNSDGENFLSEQLLPSQSIYKWIAKDLPKDKYFAFLDIENEISMALKLERV